MIKTKPRGQEVSLYLYMNISLKFYKTMCSIVLLADSEQGRYCWGLDFLFSHKWVYQ